MRTSKPTTPIGRRRTSLLRRVLFGLLRYVAALCIVAICFTSLLLPGMRDAPGTPILVAFLSIMLCAWCLGFGPGIFATALIVIATFPNQARSPNAPNIRMSLFTVSGVLICTLIQSLHNARRKAQMHAASLDAVFKASVDAIKVVDRDGRFLHVSQGAALLNGRTPEEIVGKTWTEAGLAADVNERFDQLRKAAVSSGKPWRGEIEATTNGEQKHYDYIITPVREPNESEYGKVIVVARDITEQKHAQDALRTSEERLALATEAAELGSWDVDLASRICNWSARQAELFGFAPNQLEVSFDVAMDRIHPEDRCLLEQKLSDARESKRPFQIDFRILLADGTFRWLANFGRFQCSESGTATRVLGMSQEITSRKRAEDALRESERKVVAILESVTDGFITVDRQWRFSYLNPQSEPIVGRSRNDLLGRNLWEEFPSALGTEFDHQYHRAMEEGVPVAFEEYYAPLDRWINVHAYPSADGLSLFFTDVSEKRRAEEALRTYANRLESLHEIDLAILEARSSEEIATAALQHLAGIVPACTGAAVLYHFDQHELKVLSSIGRANQCDPPITRLTQGPKARDQLALLRNGLTVGSNDVQNGSLTGTLLEDFAHQGLRSYILAPLMDRGELIGLLMLGSDASDAYANDAAVVIREIADHLAIAIRQSLLHDEILSANDRLERMSRRLILAEETERRRIARELHDETGQGLMAVKINLRGALRNLSAPGAKSRVEESVELVDRTIAQVRSLSTDLRPSLLDDFGLIIALQSYCNAVAQRLGMTVQLHADSTIGRCDTEVETACYRIVQEALNNITKHAEASEIRVQLERAGENLILQIRDNGIGFNVPAAQTRATAGSSFGVLGMTERAVLVGGSLNIESVQGKGTIVSAVLPLATHAQAEPALA